MNAKASSSVKSSDSNQPLNKRKQDLLAAQRAERQRKQAQSKFLREQRRKMMRLKEDKERELLMEKLNLLGRTEEAFTEFSRTLG